jgi:hypothetical protein
MVFLGHDPADIHTFCTQKCTCSQPCCCIGGTSLRNPVIATTQSAGSRPVIPNDGDRKFRTMATTPRSEATLVY